MLYVAKIIKTTTKCNWSEWDFWEINKGHCPYFDQWKEDWLVLRRPSCSPDSDTNKPHSWFDRLSIYEMGIFTRWWQSSLSSSDFHTLFNNCLWSFYLPWWWAVASVSTDLVVKVAHKFRGNITEERIWNRNYYHCYR